MPDEDAVLTERHRGWDHLYNFATGEEVVKVRRKDGTEVTYRGQSAHTFWLRSRGLKDENIAAVRSMEDGSMGDLVGSAIVPSSWKEAEDCSL